MRGGPGWGPRGWDRFVPAWGGRGTSGQWPGGHSHGWYIGEERLRSSRGLGGGCPLWGTLGSGSDVLPFCDVEHR